MCERSFLSFRRPACLENDDRLARDERLTRQFQEASAAAKLLGEGDDNMGFRIGNQMLDNVGRVDDRFVAHAD